MSFERYTERARQVVVLAQEEALNSESRYIRLDHLVLGLIQEREGVGARVLAKLGVKEEDVRSRIPPSVDPIGTRQQRPFTASAKKVLELSLREALALGHNYIGTEHILLGVARVKGSLNESIAQFDPGRIHDEVIDFLKPQTKAVASQDDELKLPRFTAEDAMLHALNVLYDEIRDVRKAVEALETK